MKAGVVSKLLSSVALDADFRMVSPTGGDIHLTAGPQADIHIACSDEQTLWAGFRFAGSLGYPSSLLKAGRKRNPLQQTVLVSINEQPFLRWSPGGYPRVQSLRLLLRWWRSR